VSDSRSRVEITIAIDPASLGHCGDAQLVLFWHVAQANPAHFGDPIASQLVETIGREIIRRWLKAVPPELWHHQGRHYEWSWLRKFAKYEPGSKDPQDPDWYRGTWVARGEEDADVR
jgi:hypothetical protein